jgi:hypothetical protein
MTSKHPARIFSTLLKLLSLCALAAAALLFGGCGKKAQVTGEVRDGFGRPLTGVRVSVQGTTFEATTGGDGSYAVAYVPGKVALSFRKEGHTSASLAFDIAAEASYPAEKVVLYEVPQGAGVYFFGEREYVPLARGKVTSETRTAQPQFGDERAFYTAAINELVYRAEGEFTRLPDKAILRFVDTDTGRRKLLFRLGEGGRVIRRAQTAIGGVSYEAEVRPETVRHLSAELPARESSLPPGRYAFVTSSFDPDRAQRGGWLFSSPSSGIAEEPAYLFEVGRGAEDAAVRSTPPAADRQAASTAVAGAAQPPGADFAGKKFGGAIDGKYKIQMVLTRQGSNLTGHYFYEKYRREISLSGRVEAGGDFALTETDRSGAATGTFRGRFDAPAQPASLSGTWADARGRRSLPFSLTAGN